MKPSIFVMVDMEGISGIAHSPQVRSDSGAPYQEGRRFLTWDTNACIEGCFRGGAGRVVVRDAHAGGVNFLWDLLDERAEYIQGRTGPDRMPDLEDFNAVILLGYHAMAGTPAAILEHTMSSAGWQNLWINGTRSGEIAIDAAIAGDRNVPVIMVSGDDKACAEACQFLGDIATAQVKHGYHCQGGRLLSRPKAHALITETAETAVRNWAKARPYKVSSPVTLRLERVSRGDIPERPGIKAFDARTYEVTAPTVGEALLLL